MIDLELFVKAVKTAGVEFITGVPDTLLNDFCLYIEKEWQQDRHVIAANEGNAVALAAGFHLATGSVPLVYMQNSGLGNAINPLLSLVNKEVYSIPMIMLIGWRGEPGVDDHAQHQKQGKMTPVLLDALGVPFRILDNDLDDAVASVNWAVITAKKNLEPVALLVRKGVLQQGQKKDVFLELVPYPLSREGAIDCLLKSIPDKAFFVASTGRMTRELFELRNISHSGHERDLLNVGAMGHTSSIAAGLALARKEDLIVCLDGDAAAIMHLGALTTMGKLALPNFLHVVLNNGVHESVGGQSSAGMIVDLNGIAEKSGYRTIGHAVSTKDELQSAIKALFPIKTPTFIEVRIRKGIRSDLPLLRISYLAFKKLFMQSINEVG